MYKKLTVELEAKHVHDDALAGDHVVLGRPARLGLLSRAEHQGADAVRVAETYDANPVDHHLNKNTETSRE